MITGVFRRNLHGISGRIRFGCGKARIGIRTIRSPGRFRLLHLGETCRVQKFFFDWSRTSTSQKKRHAQCTVHLSTTHLLADSSEVPNSKLKRQRIIRWTYTSREKWARSSENRCIWDLQALLSRLRSFQSRTQLKVEPTNDRSKGAALRGAGRSKWQHLLKHHRLQEDVTVTHMITTPTSRYL
jgi:hypothetical protein